MASPVRAQSSWADLQPDLLTTVGTLIDAVSHIRCSAVCTSWASVLRPNRSNLPPVRRDQPIPWLLLSGENLDSNPNNPTFIFYDMLTRTSYKTPVRCLSGQRWLGSDSGWVITLDSLCNLHLIKPLYGVCVSLPKITTIPVFRTLLPCNYDSNGNVIGYCGMDLKKFGRSFFKKVIICRTPDSETGFLVVGLFARFHLVVAKSGDKKWTLLDDLKRVYHDAVFYNEKLYAITGDSIHCWDLVGSNFGPRRKICDINVHLYGWSNYVVGFGDDLFMVSRHRELLRSTVQNYETIDVKIYKINLNNDDDDDNNNLQRSPFVRINRLDDVAIFLGTSNSKAVPTLGIDGIKGNCVYFTDDAWWSFIYPNGPYFNRDLGVFDLGDETYQPFYPKEELVNWPPPTWFWP